jgi:hypothetical protein
VSRKSVNRAEQPLEMALRHISECEARLEQQKQLIARLKKQGRSTAQAEDVLKVFEETLLQLQNHLEIMRQLMTGDT